MFDLGSARLKPYTEHDPARATRVPEARCRTASASRATRTPRRTPASRATRTGISPPTAPMPRAARWKRRALHTEQISRVVGPRLVGAVRQGQSAQPDQPPHQHHGDDQAGRARCQQTDLPACTRGRQSGAGSDAAPEASEPRRRWMQRRRNSGRCFLSSSCTLTRDSEVMRAPASALPDTPTRSRKSPRRMRSAMISWWISAQVRMPMPPQQRHGGHQPCSACWSRNARPEAGTARNGGRPRHPAPGPPARRPAALASSARSISHSCSSSRMRSSMNASIRAEEASHVVQRAGLDALVVPAIVMPPSVAGAWLCGLNVGRPPRQAVRPAPARWLEGGCQASGRLK